MPTNTPAETARYIEEFRASGAIRLRNAFDRHWIDSLRDGIEQVLSGAASALRDEFTPSGKDGRFVSELFAWTRSAVFEDFVRHSPAASIAGGILGSRKVNLLFDQILVKEPKTGDRTNWHQDLPYWPIHGEQVLTIWLALDPVTADSGAVQFVRGSHLWNTRYRPEHPLAVPGGGIANADLPRCPSIHKAPDQYEIISWDLEPGDCYIFDSRTIHGAAGNTSSSRRRRGYTTRWTGDDVRYASARHVLELPADPKLEEGAPLDSDLFPILWRRAEAASAAAP